MRTPLFSLYRIKGTTPVFYIEKPGFCPQCKRSHCLIFSFSSILAMLVHDEEKIMYVLKKKKKKKKKKNNKEKEKEKEKEKKKKKKRRRKRRSNWS